MNINNEPVTNLVVRRPASPVFAAPQNPLRRNEAPFSIQQVLGVARRRRNILAVCTGLMLGLALTAWAVLKPKYQSVATLQINKEDTDALGLDPTTAATEAGVDALAFNVEMGTHADALQTDTVALQVIRQFHLDESPEYRWQPSLFDPPEVQSELTKPLEEAPHKRDSVLKAFHRHLKIEPLTGTRLIEVRFKDSNAKLAAAVANAITNDYIEQNFRTRYTATAQVSDWLSKQLEQLKDQMRASDQKLADYQAKTGILGVNGGTDVVVSKLEDLNKQLTEAEDNRITRQAIYEIVKSGNAELVSGLAGSSFAGTGLTGQNPLENLQRLRQQQAEVKLRYAEASKKFGSAYPKLIELENQLRTLDSEVDNELQKLGKRAENDYLAAQNTETKLSALFQQQKAEANAQNSKAVQLSLLKQEAESNRTLYDNLQQKLKSALVLSGLRSTNMVVVDPARPSVDPVRPLSLFVALGLVSGLLMGVAIAFGKEALDTTVRTPDQAQALTFLPELGLIPDWNSVPMGKVQRKTISRSTKPIALVAAESVLSDAYRQLRTEIYFSSQPPPKVLMIGSPTTEDGKTTTAINLATVLGHQGYNVLLVDADLRRPSLHARLGLKSSTGLGALLRRPELRQSDCIIQSGDQPQLYLLADRAKTPLSAELLASSRLTAMLHTWRQVFDYIIIDSSPVLSATDAVVLAQKVDSVLLVVRSGATPQAALIRSRDVLLRAGAKVAGVVVNGVDVKSADYGNYYDERYRATSA